MRRFIGVVAMALICACGDDDTGTERDGGVREGGVVVRDGGSSDLGPDGSTVSCPEEGCDDGDPCTRDRCFRGSCRHEAIPGCSDCESGADCDDGDPDTRDECRTDFFGTPSCVNERRECLRGCEDFEACTTDLCVDGYCRYEPVPDCAGCRSDTECDDGDPATVDRCNPLTRACGHVRDDACTGFEPCDDGDPCTTDNCNSLDECTHGPNYGCCHYDSDCFDGNECTTNERCVGQACVRDEIPGCDCVDRDGDGYSAEHCGGDDCDDFDPLSNPGAMEMCDAEMLRDRDCDGLALGADPDCRSASVTCAGATSIAFDMDIATNGVGSDDLTTCGGTGVFFQFTLPETSDVRVTVTVDEETHPADARYDFGAFLQSACGVAEDLFGGGGCGYWEPAGTFFPGSATQTFDALRVPAGTYVLEVRGGLQFDTVSLTDLLVRVERTASMDAECTSPPTLMTGTTTSTTTGGTDAFRSSCTGTVESAPERVHRLANATRERWRITARDTASPARPVRLGLYDTCDPSAAATACVQALSASCQPERTLDLILEPGERFLVVEASRVGSIDYALDVHSEPLGASCASAPVITGSGSASGDTSAASDDFRVPDVCGDGAGPDEVVRIDVAATGRVVIDLIASYGDAVMTLREECGGPVLHRDDARIDRTLAAGTYYLVVDGEEAAASGTWTVNVTVP